MVDRHERKDLGLHEGGRLGRVVRQRDEAAGRCDELGEGDEREETVEKTIRGFKIHELMTRGNGNHIIFISECEIKNILKV